MNIVFFTDMYNIGGGERNLVELAAEMQQSGENIIVLLPCKGQLTTELEKRKISYYQFGLNIINRRWFKGIPLFIDYVKVFRILCWLKGRNFSPEIIHCYASNTIPLAKMLALIYKAKIIWTCHGPWEVPGKVKNFFMKRFVDNCVTITPEIHDKLDIQNKYLIPLGIKSQFNNYPVQKIRNNEKKRILCIARWQHIKGQDILIKAFKLVKEQIDNVELHFFGDLLTNNKNDAEFYKDIKELVAKYNLEKSVCFHGFVPDIRQHIDEYDVLCIPSRYESFSITLLEGLNSGVIVLAPNIGGPSYIIEDGISGILFEVENHQDLSHKCIEILSKKRELDKEKICARGRAFLIERQSENLKEIYKEIL